MGHIYPTPVLQNTLLVLTAVCGHDPAADVLQALYFISAAQVQERIIQGFLRS